MSRADLDRIQTQLKVAIQSHQILVGKMKNDPQNTTLQKQLHELQSQITSLSEKQKTIVQTLRKELVIKQSTPSVQIASVASLSPGVASGTLSQTTCAKPTGPECSNPMTHAAKVPRISNPSGRPPTIAQLTSVHSSSATSFYRPPNPTRIQASPSTTNNNTIKGKALSPKSSYPAIRVPQYPGSRPSILMGGQSSPNTQRPSGVLKNSCASNLPLTAQRGSDADLENMKHSSIEQKELPPGERQKLEYMASLDLITPDTLKELQRKRSERKRRSTANPQFSYGHFEPENDVHEDFCAVCRRSGELLMCDTCNLVYHLGCLEPPLTTIPQGLWSCPNCQTMSKHGGVTWPGSLALVHSYITHKAAREEEKRTAEKKNEDLKSEKSKLENRAKQLTDAMKQHLKQKAELLSAKTSAQQSVDTLKNLIRVFHAS